MLFDLAEAVGLCSRFDWGWVEALAAGFGGSGDLVYDCWIVNGILGMQVPSCLILSTA